MAGTNEGNSLFRVDCLAAIANCSLNELREIHGHKTPKGELIEVLSVDHVMGGFDYPADHLPWLIGVAADHLTDGRPRFVSVFYK